ncbi:MAG: beta-ketoacyl synthase N-terminal-like domain-containing protein [Desulfobacteraceae bacterium]|jgi:3-oxoacyl-[acyl-carrier-protein] synthase II
MTPIEPKIVLTGLACMHPIGKNLAACSDFLRGDASNKKESWYNLDYGEFPIGRIPNDYYGHNLTPMEMRSYDRISMVVCDTVGMCISNAGLSDQPDLLTTTGIMSGSGFGCLESQDHLRMVLKEKGPAYFDPVAFPWTSHNFPISAAAIKFGLKGPITAMITSMSAGLNAVIYSAYQILKGQTERMIAVAFDEINALQYAYLKEKKYLECTTYDPKDHSAKAVYPTESCVAWMLESEQSARQRQARIYGRLCQWHLSAGQWAKTNNNSLGQGIMSVIPYGDSSKPANIKFVTHGSGFQPEDDAENQAVKQLAEIGMIFQDYIQLKPIIGNCLGAAALIEGALLLNDPAPIEPCPPFSLDDVSRCYLLNSFGMGANQIALTIQSAQPTHQ